MDPLKRLTPELRANFVAYLDGELDEHQTQQVEAVLSQSAVARNDMENLARTYELLAVLPHVESSEDFTAKTLATARLDVRQFDPTQTSAYRMAREVLRGAVWVAAIGASAALGFLITNRWIPGSADPLLYDLPVIEQWDVYAEIGRFEFLQRLAGQDDLTEEMRAQQIDDH